MKFTKDDINELKQMGCLDKDIPQIQKAADKGMTKYACNGHAVSREQAIEILGRRRWLSGLARSAFHYTCTRTPENEMEPVVSFDSAALFH